MTQLLQAICPKCRQALRIPSQWTNSLLRCKKCGTVIRASGLKMPVTGSTVAPPVTATPLAITTQEKPAVENVPPADPNLAATVPLVEPPNVEGATNPVAFTSPATEDAANPFAFISPAATNGQNEPFELPDDTPAGPNPYLAQIRRRRGRRRLIAAGVLLLLASAVAVAIYYDLHCTVIDQLRQWRSKTHSAFEGAVSHNDVPLDTAPTILPPTAPSAPTIISTAPALPAPKNARYWGRAILVGVKNYLYINPLNPGYRPNKDVNSTRDPLGLTGLRQVLVKSMGFPPEQVAELSDVAVQKPVPPLKAAITENVENFLGGCRPNDRVVLTMVCHVLEVEGKNYFVPLEGEPDKVDTLIPVEWLFEQLGKCASKHKLVILDLSPFDPEEGSLRHASGLLSPKLEEQLQKPPENTLVWLSCSGGEHSYQFASNGFPGSVFMRYVQDCGTNISEPKKARRWNPPKDAKEGSIPLIAYIPVINEEVTKYVKDRATAPQTPRLFGSDNNDPDPALAEPPPPVTIHAPKGADQLADPKLMEGIYKELSMAEDSTQAIGAESMPPFWAKNMAAYAADYAGEKDFDEQLATHPLRKAAIDASKLLQKHTTAFRTTFRASANDAQFKKMLEKEQETPAIIDFDLSQALDEMEKAAKERSKETSKRWQAHFDFVYARLLARLAYSREYNFVLGNRLRKDSPVLKDSKNHNGWRIVPQDRVQDKEAKAHASKRQKILDRLIKENPNTPWEVLARKDLSTNLGLTIQEAKVE